MFEIMHINDHLLKLMKTFVDIDFQEFAKTFDSCVVPDPRLIINTNAQLIFMEAANEAKTAYIRGMDRVKKFRKFRSNFQTVHFNLFNLKFEFQAGNKLKFVVGSDTSKIRNKPLGRDLTASV